MKFECNCKNEEQFREMVDELHEAKTGFNFEIGARLWFSQDDKTVMVEYDVATQDCKELLDDDESEPDYLSAYWVKDENDYDCSCEVDTVSIDTDISLTDLNKEMLDYAKEVLQKLALKEKASNKVEDLISDATDRAGGKSQDDVEVDLEK